jgi:hypothetical protein
MLGNSDGNVDTTLNQGRVQINTLSKFPSFFYTGQEYHSFTLSTVVVPSEFERSGVDYENILNNFIRSHKPFIAKSCNGRIYVVNVSNPKVTQPLNTWDGYDYFQLNLECVEVMDYVEFMTE